MHRWLFVGLALMAAVGGIGTALVSGQRVQNPALGLELIAMSEETSANGYVVRLGETNETPQLPDPDELQERMKSAQELADEHTDRLKEIVAEFGWPGKRLVGHDGAHAAWILLQRADEDFQREALALMRRMPKGQVDPYDLAVLTDRVAMRADEPQTYGTQIGCDYRTGQLEVVNGVVDPQRVDALREEVGLPPLRDELENARVGFGACVKN